MRSFAFPPCAGSSTSLVKKDQPEVCLSVPLQDGLCFLRHLLPASSSAFLAVGFAAARRRYGFTVFRVFDTDGLGSGYSSAAILSVRFHMLGKRPCRTPFGSGLSAPLACSYYRGLSPVHLLNLAIKPGPRSALMLADPNVASRFHSGSRRGTLSRQLHTPPLPAAHVPIGYR